MMKDIKEQQQQSLYTPSMEHEACGIGFVANLKGERSHQIIEDALTMLENMEHRGATGFEPNTGDGAGILIQNPHTFFTKVCKKQGFDLPEQGKYGVGMLFFPADYHLREACRAVLYEYIEKFGFELLGVRIVPTNNSEIGAEALSVEPHIEQIFIRPLSDFTDGQALERRFFVFREFIHKEVHRRYSASAKHFYFASLSYKTIVYKGQLTSSQLRHYYPDLEDKTVDSALAVIHSRFSTNTFPEWKLAQPFRFLAHNGEINTLRGNLNWMKSYQTLFRSSLFTKEEIELILPLLDDQASDSSNLDRVLEMLLLGGRELPHVMMMLIPEAWENDPYMSQEKKDFYEFHYGLIEPWDGPASLCITDGTVVGACLDRNGLRPSRYLVTDDNRVVMGSEAGALPVDPERVIHKGRVEAGKIFIADLEKGRIISDEELKARICTEQPYGQWLKKNTVYVDELSGPASPVYPIDKDTILLRQKVHGFSWEDLKMILRQMFQKAKEPISSMGSDTPLAVLSSQSQHLSNYFKQLFAQVSNPPMDSIRERVVMSLHTSVGKTLDILAAREEHARKLSFEQPVLTNEDLDKVRDISHPNFKCKTIHAVFEASDEPGTLELAIDRICRDAEEAIRYGCYNILLISDRKTSAKYAPIPSLLAVGAVHHHLIKNGMRVRVGLLVEAGDVRETHHFATLIGYGANAINPYMAFESIHTLRENSLLKNLTDEQAIQNYIEAIGSGLLKIFAKMGISTLRSYHGAQIFEILGLGNEVVEKCFKGTISRIGGMGFDDIAREVLVRHHTAFPKEINIPRTLELGGLYHWRRRGDYHLFNPDTVRLLQQACRTNNFGLFQQYASFINDQSSRLNTIRGVLKFKSDRRPILLEEVEPKEKILRRFATGAMSFGSLSYEAHRTLAVAMNRIGGKSNSGEGGEDPVRFTPKEENWWERSAIKQVASGRFGVSSYYLTNADEIQIKMAQGAKPGEGGQLPGHKVNDWIARVRNSTPGVGLISPPPHHDIYSIEDLAQLIYDLKNANRHADISVKLVSEAGVGTIAAGVAKAKADTILISGGDGGTGASPMSSIRHTGLPWELGISEAHQTLVKNNLRSRVKLQTDGQIKTGRDLAIAALLGAEEWGVASAALVVMGCIMMRKCHKNTCPVGIATQREELREKFTGQADHVVNFIEFLVEDLRLLMSELGFRTVDEMIGQASDILEVRQDIPLWKAQKVDLNCVIYKQPNPKNIGVYKQMEQNHGLDTVLDWKLLEKAKPAIENGEKVYAEFSIRNIDRTTGALLSNEISKKFKDKGLPSGQAHFKFRGSAGQSFGAFAVHGLHFELEGEANDYFGKGLSGGGLIVYPDSRSHFKPSKEVIIGNVAFYGAISGEAYINGLAGQRFCVRNSGAKVVVEGIGDHGCEYMTGGIAVILGKTGRNFAAGMSGGIAYVYDENEDFKDRCNMELVELESLDDDDVAMLSYLIEKHHKFTKSEVAEAMLADWKNTLRRFVKVMPLDYKTAIEKSGKRITVPAG